MSEEKLSIKKAEASKPAKPKTDYVALVRNISVVLAFLLMIAVPVFQWMEIEEYEIKDSMFERIGNMFSSDEESNDSSNNAADSDNSESADEKSEGESDSNSEESSEE